MGVECSPTPPSDSTIGRVVRLVSPEILSKIVTDFLGCLPRQSVGMLPNLYALDGKARKAALTDTGKTEIDLSLYDVATKVLIDKFVVGSKEGEAPVARDLVEKTAAGLAPGYFSADAGIGCREFADVVVRNGHDFLLVLKGNAGHVFEEMKSLPWNGTNAHKSAQRGHGRFETRCTEIFRDEPDQISKFIPSAKHYPADVIFGRILRHRTNLKTAKSSDEAAYFIASERHGTLTSEFADALVRGHWCIENELHGHRDVQLGEDDLPEMSSHASRVIGSILDLHSWLASGCGRGICYFIQRLRADPLSLIRRWQEV